MSDILNFIIFTTMGCFTGYCWYQWHSYKMQCKGLKEKLKQLNLDSVQTVCNLQSQLDWTRERLQCVAVEYHKELTISSNMREEIKVLKDTIISMNYSLNRHVDGN